jgi:hypothetical protein
VCHVLFSFFLPIAEKAVAMGRIQYRSLVSDTLQLVVVVNQIQLLLSTRRLDLINHDDKLKRIGHKRTVLNSAA